MKVVVTVFFWTTFSQTSLRIGVFSIGSILNIEEKSPELCKYQTGHNRV